MRSWIQGQLYNLQAVHNHRKMSFRLERTYEANPGGENSSFIFTVCVKSVPHYHFKLAHVVLYMAVKGTFRKPFLKLRNRLLANFVCNFSPMLL